MSRSVRQLELEAALTAARRIGAIGPGALAEHLDQAFGYLAPGGLAPGAQVLDLGSGGGLPALPLALVRPDTRWILVEAWRRRADTLRRTVRLLGLEDRVTVLADRAEDVGRGPWRARIDVVTARSFAIAPVTLECAAPLLRPGGTLRCSVRDDEPTWPPEVLAALGLGHLREWRVGRFAYRACTATHPCAETFPRRAGVPERRPLF
jgi:16S rRNA (guanine527-N7)-methyltransferase